jgi:hypothetical protein
MSLQAPAQDHPGSVDRSAGVRRPSAHLVSAVSSPGRGLPALRDGTQVVRGLARVAWAPKGELEQPAWVAVGRYLGAINRVSQWWLGDWLLYGAAKWGEKYAEAAKITGYDPGSLRNMASLAAQFDLSRRRDKLTWCHHAAVAGLERDEQEHWLDRAVALTLSVADVRVELRALRRRRERILDSTGDPPPDPVDVDCVVCPNCGHTVPLPTGQ